LGTLKVESFRNQFGDIFGVKNVGTRLVDFFNGVAAA